MLIDLWAKMDRPRSVYSDITPRRVCRRHRSRDVHQEIFKIVAAARDAAIDCVREAYKAGRTLHGWEVDDASRAVIQKAGYGEYFVHRTGHSIGQEVHGNGANMDNLETHDERIVMKGTCFSVEPGIYLPEFGVRQRSRRVRRQRRTGARHRRPAERGPADPRHVLKRRRRFMKSFIERFKPTVELGVYKKDGK